MNKRPIVCTIDLETTGLDFKKSEITEVAYVIKEWGARKPLAVRHAYLSVENPVPEFITELTGIGDELLEECGEEPHGVLLHLKSDMGDFKVDYVLAQNGVGFDRPMLVSKMKEHNLDHSLIEDTPWVDSKEDIEWPESFKSTSLKFLACELGFLNPFPHDALMDVMTTIRVVEEAEKQGITSLDIMIENSNISWVYVESNAEFHQKEAAKKLRYRWEQIDEVRIPKRWINKFKENKLEEAQKAANEAGFKIRRIQNDKPE